MENYIAFVTLSTGSKHKITQETHNQILEAEKDDFIVLPNGVTFKNSAVMEIQDIAEWVNDGYSYGQPYGEKPKELPGRGYDGIIKKAPNLGLEAMARGLKKTIAARKAKGLSVDNAEKLLAQMRVQYSAKNSLKQMA